MNAEIKVSFCNKSCKMRKRRQCIYMGLLFSSHFFQLFGVFGISIEILIHFGAPLPGLKNKLYLHDSMSFYNTSMELYMV